MLPDDLDYAAPAPLICTQASCGEALLRGTLCWLRWSGDVEEAVLYTLLALEAGETGLLQYVLHAMPEIHDVSPVM